jgi:hypothetical protein
LRFFSSRQFVQRRLVFPSVSLPSIKSRSD